jgi:TIGR03009 family protein
MTRARVLSLLVVALLTHHVAAQAPVRQPIGPQAPVAQPAAQPAAQPGVQPGTPLPAGPAAIPLAPAIAPQKPDWIPLDPAHEKWVDQILQYWETSSSNIKTLSCNFTRWEYDPVFGPRDAAKTIAEGEIKYAEPDKGLLKVSKLLLYGPPAKPGEQPNYVPQDASFGEHWVCDGKRIFEFDARNKRVIERELPPEMQGKAIADGPLPFLFGTKAETIKARYWVRGNPKSGNGKFWLDAVPKARQGAQNFKQVLIVLDEKTFLPELLEVQAPNFNPQNPARTVWQLSKHETLDKNANPLNIARLWQVWQRDFSNPATPLGWTRVVENAQGQAAAPQNPPRNFSPLPR